jgi:GrpB-like predicted nucleotidyltransferase (UPF0157 family)
LNEPIRLTAYDPAWPRQFEREQDALSSAIGAWVSGGIHHVGSTAVPGLEAKPIIDILVGVRDLDQSRACFGPLAGLERYRAELSFRDRLRADDELAAEYRALKRLLSRRFEHDREAYTAAKADFIQRALVSE